MTSENSGKPYYIVSSLARGISILELLAEKKSVSVTEAARALDLNRSAAHRFLATLREMGYVVKGEHSRYRLSLKLFELGHAVANIKEIVAIVRPYMRALSTRHKETVNLGRMDGNDTVIIDVVLGTEAIRFDSRIGERSPSHTLAMGKVLLAFHSEQVRQDYVKHANFTPVTANTITDPERFLRELETVRRDGYAIDDEEWAEGLRCVSAPIFTSGPYPDYAISISGPTLRMTMENMKKIRVDLAAVCAEISNTLAGHGFSE